ncbi:hypothetical protein N7495_002871 [Penicillium taxi]|uniref:uncharacterized protein n=1 Tax=Penicillium taxi TaxID=168475 RepID=UPI002544DDBB|nr:uncharacterized protein N7495_002871 [Penicillium taxi]KAJ5902343.1 hypothetical protein N7495_002871 [Penicillium taxi]
MRANLNTRTDICAPLERLYRQIRDFDSDFPTTDDIQSFDSQINIRVTKVDIAENSNGTLQFNQCFFLPHPENVFREYPINVKEHEEYGDVFEEDECKLEDLTTHSNVGIPYELEPPGPYERLHEADHILECIDWNLKCYRYPKVDPPPGYHGCFNLFEFRGLEIVSPYIYIQILYTKTHHNYRSLNEIPVMARLRPKDLLPSKLPSKWRFCRLHAYRYHDENDPKPCIPNIIYQVEGMPWPHVIVTCTAEICVSDAESGLTSYELESILKEMARRVLYKNLGSWSIYPVSISIVIINIGNLPI